MRGSIFGGSYKSIDKEKVQHMNITWITFWFFVECTVGKQKFPSSCLRQTKLMIEAFIIACIVSFRALFAQRDTREEASAARRHEQALQAEKNGSPLKPSSFAMRARRLHSSLLETMRSLETTHGNEDTILPVQEPRSVSLTFLRDEEDVYRHPSSDASMGENTHTEVPK